jgi:sporulation integral membrane protein YtvI
MDSKYEKRKKFIVNVLFFTLITLLLYFAIKYVLGWILPFIIGLLVALLLRRAIRFLSEKCRLPYKAAAIILVLLFYAVVGVLLTLLVGKIITVLTQGFSALPTVYLLYIEPLIKRLLDGLQNLTAKLDPSMVNMIDNMKSSLSDSAGSLVTGLSAQVIKYLSSTIVTLPGLLLGSLLSVISSVFFAMDFGYITGFVMNMLPEKMRGYAARLKKVGAGIGLKYVKSYAILISVTFLELFAGFLILGVDNAIGIAAITALVDLLPLLGTGSILIPWAVIKLVQGNYLFALEIAVLYIIITIVRQVLEPRIVGRQIGVHPLAMLISMYVGLRLFGFIGIFVLPILLVVVKSFYDSRKADEACGITEAPKS